MFIKTGDLKPIDYKGIPEMAAYRLHADIFEILKPFLQGKLRVLDLGCGQGAFSQRLVDQGMTVDACDLDTNQLKANVSRKIELDLNSEIPPEKFPEKYDIILALEIIEHLHNPWKCFDDCKKLLRTGGIMVLTTPNISNFLSRLRFFMRGTLMAYEKTDLKHGHITPLSFIQIENLAANFGFEIIKKGYAGPIPLFHFYELSRFTLLRNTVLPLLYPLMSGPKKGRALIFILRKND